MALFRRRSTGSSNGPAASFWDWWTTQGRGLAEDSIAGRLDPHSFAETMTPRVKSLGELGWELTSGDTSEHVLVLTSRGDPALRAAARRAVLAAPDADATWSYVDSRPPVPHPEAVVVDTEDVQVDLSRVRVSARMSNGRFDVQLHHPCFSDLPPDGRSRVASLILDTTLGEVDAELWLREVLPVELSPLDGFGLSALRAVVLDLKRQRLDGEGRPPWAMLRGETPQGPLLAMVRLPLHVMTAPQLDTYVGVSLPYSHATESGLPDEGSLEPLRLFEARLEAELGTSGLVVAHLSNAGVRTLHVYVDSSSDVVPVVKGLAKVWDQGRASVHDMHDPGWDAVQHLSG